MKLLIANYRYFVSGGPERYMFNLINALDAHGHEIVPFSVRYDRNRPTPYARYFVPPLGSESEITFREQQQTPGTLWRTVQRLFYAPEVERAVRRLVVDTQPQVAYILHYLRKLSPSLLVGLKKEMVPVAVRLSDYAMVCPQSHCLRDDQPCRLCAQGNLVRSIRYRCVQHSLAASILNALATWYHRFRHYFDLIDVFVTTNSFMYQTMVSAGFPEKRLRCIPTFVDAEIFRPSPGFAKDGYIAYAGRLVPTKGVHVLIDAFAQLRRRQSVLDLQLRIAGSGDEQYTSALKDRVERANLGESVQFVGELAEAELSIFLSRALLSVVPSLWYDNLPNAILESYACGTPVLASNHGSLSECVDDSETGYLFRAGDADYLANRLKHCLDNPGQINHMSYRAREVAEQRYSAVGHLATLEQLLGELAKGSKRQRL